MSFGDVVERYFSTEALGRLIWPQKDWKVCGLEGQNGNERPLLPEAQQDITKREISLETTLQRMWNVGMKLAREKGNSNRPYQKNICELCLCSPG